MTLSPEKSHLDTAEWIEISPTFWSPETGDEKLAALIGYNTGDGSVTSRPNAAFYALKKEDVMAIAQDCWDIGLGLGCDVYEKKSKPGYAPTHQFQVGGDDARTLVEDGAPIGKKTEAEFDVPDWIKTGSLGVKRAYMAALFGAEGNTPALDKTSRSRSPRQPVLSMCKIAPISGDGFFQSLKTLMRDLGIESTVTQTSNDKFGKTYIVNWLRIAPNPDNLIRFYKEVGYLYCAEKQLKAWLWMQYLKCYVSERDRRRNVVESMVAENRTWAEIGAEIGITRGAAHRLWSDIKSGKKSTAGHGFPFFDTWLKERWIEELGLLRVRISARQYKSPATVWNMLVSSPDHSYLLASGVNNFNSFETMSNRVYHAFDRKRHLARVQFDPRLPIRVGMDFNIDPMSAALFQIHDEGTSRAVIKVFDEICLRNSNTFEMSEELERRYWRHRAKTIIYPDPAGGSKSTTSRGDSDFSILRTKGFKRLKYRRKHPRVRDRVNSVNRMLQSADGTIRIQIDHSCKELIKSLEQTQYKEKKVEIDKSAGLEHMTDAFGYGVELEFPVRELRVLGVSI